MILSCAVLLSTLAACDGALPMAPAEVELVAIASAGPSFSTKGNGNGNGGGNSGGGLVSITPSGTHLVVGESIQLVGVDGGGNTVDVKWSTSDPTVATVTAAGVVTGVGIGTAHVAAKHKSTSVTAVASVTAPVNSTNPPPPPPPSPTLACDDFPRLRTVPVSTAAQLSAALADARPGDLIRLADGSYTGRWTIGRSGTAATPVVLCGGRDAILQDTRYDGGAVLLLRGAEHWVLHGFTIRKALWAVRLERSSHNRISGLLVHDIGQEGIAIREFSSRNVVQGNRIHDTGRRGWDFQQWGEAIYVGTWSGHWTNGTPDRSDYNQILDNHIGPNVTAEHIDIKEGTTGGVIRGNYFDGRGMANNAPSVDAWVLVQGNEYLIEDNHGVVTRAHGFRIWPGHDGNWGQRNTFRNNIADVQAPGYGFMLQGNLPGNLISCGNVVTNAGAGFANVACS